MRRIFSFHFTQEASSQMCLQSQISRHWCHCELFSLVHFFLKLKVLSGFSLAKCLLLFIHKLWHFAKIYIGGIPGEFKAWLADKSARQGPGKHMFWEATWIYMCLIHNTNEQMPLDWCHGCHCEDLPLQRNFVDSICIIYGLGLWVCFCASHGSQSISGHKCTGDFILTGRLHQSMCTRTAIKEIITTPSNPWWLLPFKKLSHISGGKMLLNAKTLIGHMLQNLVD